MGILRFLLAMTVVIAHSQPLFGFYFVGSVIAVQSFYMISGFYMALILNEKYIGAGSYRLFITNRFLRLFPVYWVVLVATILMSLVFFLIFGQGFRINLFKNYLHLMEVKSAAYIILTNIFIFGQDTFLFLKFNSTGVMEFTSNFRNIEKPFPSAFVFLYVPQAWTLSLELMFYLIAPFLVRKSLVWIFAIIAVSLALRVYIYDLGFNYDPWTYRFFPTELAFFLVGTVSYRIYKKLKEIDLNWHVYLPLLISVVLITVFYQFIRFEGKQWAYYLLIVLTIPALFIFTRDKKIDNYLGELSYPIYISHVFILNLTTYKSLPVADNNFSIYMASLVLTILFSIALVHFLVRPIEKYRQGRLVKKRMRLEGVER